MAKIGAEREEGHQAVNALQRDCEVLALPAGPFAKGDHPIPALRRSAVEPCQYVRTRSGDLTGGVHGNRPEEAAIAVAWQGRPDEGAFQQLIHQTVEQAQISLGRDIADERMIEDDEVIAAGEILDR